MTNLCPICHSPFPDGRLDDWCLCCLMNSAAGPAGIPGIKILDEIARGGMAIVSKAEQREPRRIVAIKTLQSQWAGNEILCERFRREAQVMASLDHPKILPVYEVGDCEGLPWFTMKLADHGSLAEHIITFSGKWIEIASIISQIAAALGFAHERGVLHRDVKPGNILFDSDHAPYLADFGLAKHFDIVPELPALTLEASMLGTPAYIAPELAAGKISEGTTHSDIYSLGTVLYELLVGQPAYSSNHLPGLLQSIASSPPQTLVSINRSIPTDLRMICEKAMSREPQSRYGTAHEFADDLERFIEGRQVHARQASMLENGWYWCRRHPSLASMLALIAGLLITFTVSISLAFIKVRQANAITRASQRSAVIHLLEARLSEAEGIRRSRQPNFRDRVLNLVSDVGRPKESEEMRFKRRCEAVGVLAFPKVEVQTLELQFTRPVGPITRLDHVPEIDPLLFVQSLPQKFEHPIQSAVWSSNRKWLAMIEQNGPTHIWDAKRQGISHVLGGSAVHASQIIFSPDNRFLLTLSEQNHLTIFDLVSGLPVARLDAAPAASGKRASWSGDIIGPVNYGGTPSQIKITEGSYRSNRVSQFTQVSSGFCLSPLADYLVTAGEPSGSIWDLTGSEAPQKFQIHKDSSLLFSSEGAALFGASANGLYQWDALDEPSFGQSSTQLLPAFQKSITSLSIATDLAAIAGAEGVEIWRVVEKTKLIDLTESADSVALSADGRTLVIGRTQYEVWDVESGRKLQTLNSRPIPPSDSYCAFSPDGRWLATGHDLSRMTLWRVRDWQKLNFLESPSMEPVGHFIFSPDSSKIFNISRGGLVETWDLSHLDIELKKIDLGWESGGK